MDTNIPINQPFIAALLDSFDKFEDTRESCRIMYPLKEILFLVFSSSLCGIRSFDEIAEFGEIRIDWFRQYLPYESGIPSHDTLNRIMSWVKVEQLGEVLSELFSKQLSICDDKILHIDGKKIKGSATAKQQQTSKARGGKQSVAMVNLYSSSLQQCLASVGIDCKTNEQGAIMELLKCIEVKDCLLSLDAGFCNGIIAGQIVETGADYFIRVKQNQPKLLAAMTEILTQEKVTDYYEGKPENSHGRVEKRDCSVVRLDSISNEILLKQSGVLSKWSNLNSLVRVIRYRTDNQTQKMSEEEAYFITSKPLTAIKANQIARSHWSIENKLHWQLDVILGEDADRKRTNNSPHNMSLIHKIVLNIHQPNKVKNKSSLKREMTKCAVSDSYRTKILESL